MGRQRRYTDKQLIQAVRHARSWSQVLKQLGLHAGGGSYNQVKRLTKELDIPTGHFTGQAWNTTGLNLKKPKSLLEILVDDSTYSTYNLKIRLWKERVFKRQCLRCGVEKWFGQYNHLELDHINGNVRDHRLENLRILCANCHALTETHCGKNIGRSAGNGIRAPLKKGKHEGSNPSSGNHCVDCGIIVSFTSFRCGSCNAHAKQKIKWPPTSVLKSWVNRSSYCAVARKLGVSDNAMRKRIRNHPT